MLRESIDRVSYLALIKACWQLAEGRRRSMLALYGLLFVANAINLTQPLLIGRAVNAVAKGGDDMVPHLSLWLGATVAATIGFWCFHGPARVIEAGRIVEEGALPDLLARNGVLVRMWNAQTRQGNGGSLAAAE